MSYLRRLAVYPNECAENNGDTSAGCRPLGAVAVLCGARSSPAHDSARWADLNSVSVGLSPPASRLSNESPSRLSGPLKIPTSGRAGCGC